MVSNVSLSLKDLYLNNPYNKLRDDFLSDILQYTIHSPPMSTSDLIKGITSRFFALTLHYDSKQNTTYINAVSKLFLKIKQSQILNIFILHYKFIHSIIDEIISNNSSNNPVLFEYKADLIITPLFIYDSEKNITNVSMKITSHSIEKLHYISSCIEYCLKYYHHNPFSDIHLIFGVFPQGHIITISQHNHFLIKKHKPEIDIKEYISLIDPNSISKSLIFLEKDIRLNFKYTKRHIKNFKQSFTDLKEYLLLNSSISQEVIEICPFGSVTQLTQNCFSDLEITILTQTKNEEGLIDLIHKEISKKDKYAQIFIRKTKRTTLITFVDEVNQVKIELTLNNVFGLLNSSLIRNYLLSDSRALILINTIKYWSKRRNINGNYKGYLSSYCYTLMVIYFLQRISPPVLPTISSKNQLRSYYIKGKHYYLDKKMISDYHFKPSGNNDPVSLLLLKFFLFYYDYFQEENYCIDITSKNEVLRYYNVEYMNFFITNQRSVYCFIDPFDYSYNPGAYFGFNSNPYVQFRKALKQTIDDIVSCRSFLQPIEL